MSENTGSKRVESPVIVARNLHRSFRKTRALEAIDLVLPRGCFFGVFGPDGAGKTTLLQIMAAILDPTEGQCTVLSHDTVNDAREITSRIGYMAQGFTLYERLSVDENLRFAAQIHGVRSRQFSDRRQRLLEMAELKPFVDRRAENLSGGMRKKLALCTNLVHEPPLLLLDEPSLGVDPYSRRELWAILNQYHERGTSIVVTSSYLNEADHCDEIVFLHDGQVIAQGPPDELRDRSAGTVFEIRTSSANDHYPRLRSDPEIINVRLQKTLLRFQTRNKRNASSLINTLGISPQNLHSVPPSNEDVFIRLIDPEKQGSVPSESDPYETDCAVSQPGSISTTNITRQFGSFTAVRSVTLTIETGDIFGLLGPNGAGKTTLIRILCGLLPPSSGKAIVAGIEVTRSPRKIRSRIGYMSQSFSLYTDLTRDENLSFFARSQGLHGREKQAAIRWAKQMVNLTGDEDPMVRSLSGALKQRLALACAILHRPAVLFLDEPTSGVDPLARQRFWELVHRLSARRLTVVVTTHHLDEAHYCDRLGLLRRGQLIGKGTVETLRQDVNAGIDATIEDDFLQYIKADQRKSNGTDRS